MQVTISHFPVMGEGCCEYQSQTIALMSLTLASLQLAWLKPLDQPDSEESEQMQCSLPNKQVTIPILDS